jgi:membrane protein
VEILKTVWTMLVATYGDWSEDRASRLAAALSYYTTLSLAPLLLVVISVAGLLFGREAVQGQLVGQISALTGPDSAAAIEELLANTSKPAESVLASIIGIATLIFGATGVAWQLKDALNTIWEVAPDEKGGFWQTLRSYFVSFTLVIGVGFVLLVSLVISAALAALGTFVRSLVPGSEGAWMAVNFIVSFGVMTLLFAMMFRFLPDTEVRWSDVWIGAAATAAFFELGKILVGLYLGQAGIGSAYGAAGSLVVILVWVYYAAQILFFGAEFTQVYARRFGGRMLPQKEAVGEKRRRAMPPSGVRA